MPLKLNLRQTAVLAEVVIYCYGRRLKALTLRQEVQPIPIKKAFYDRHTTRDRDLILRGVNVWFELETQGYPGMSSMWRVRDDAQVTDEVRDCLQQYYDRNINHFLSLKSFVNAKKEKSVAPPETKFEFDSDLEARMFLEVIGRLVL
jgi:hypothetical protein